MSQIYLPGNCSAAFQLNWSLSVFGKAGLSAPDRVIKELLSAIEIDDLRILEYRSVDANSVQFFVSSQPKHSPAVIVRLIKGRWQYVARDDCRIEFRRNYCIRSVGAANSCTLNDYVARQCDKHPMADEQVQAMFKSLQYHDPHVDTALVQKSNHGMFQNALHLCIETTSGWRETEYATLEGYRASVVGSCRDRGWQLSRIGLLSNHLHILLVAGINDAPESVAIQLLNGLAASQRELAAFKHSYYVGTFGAYDRGAIWNALRKDIVSEGRRGLYQTL